MGIRFNDNSITRLPAEELSGDLVLPIEGYRDGETHNTTVEDIRQFLDAPGVASSAVVEALAAHTGANDPHSQYATDADLGTALAAHTAANDPHSQYATDADLSAALAAHTAANDPHSQYATDADLSTALAAHTAANNPHSQYATQNLANLTDPVAARTKLGLGSAAVRAAGDFEVAGTATSAVNAAITTHTSATNPHPQYLAQNLANLSDPVAARTNLGLGSAAVRAAADFDAAGAATAAANSALTTHTSATNPHPQYVTQNLANLTDTAIARTNLGLGSAAVRATTDFDAAGAATAAVSTHAASQGNGNHLPSTGITDSQVSAISATKISVAADTNLSAGTLQATLALQAQSINQLVSTQIRNQFPQLIGNGRFWINQRSGVSYTIKNSGPHTLDRWVVALGLASGEATVSQSTTVPSISQSGIYQSNSLSIKTSVAQASIASGEYGVLVHKLEGYQFQLIAQRRFTISFWVRSSVAGTYCLAAKAGDNSQSFVAEYTINSANTWEWKEVVIEPTPPGGTWNYTNGVGLILSWSLACGTSYQTAAGAWTSGNKLGTNKQANLFGAVNNEFLISDVQLQAGYPSLIYTRAQDLLLNCYPYYTRLYLSAFDTATLGANQQIEEYYTFPLPLRAGPTVNLVTAGQRTNLSSTFPPIIYGTSNRDFRFVIYSAANGYCYAISDLWEFSSDL